MSASRISNDAMTVLLNQVFCTVLTKRLMLMAYLLLVVFPALLRFFESFLSLKKRAFD